MWRKSGIQWGLVAANAAIVGVLCFHESYGAKPAASAPSGPSAGQQRAEMIGLLRDIKAELHQLNQFRQTGSLPTPE